jgi:type IV secretory pathway TraG/TraD family ATPase VirD4
MPPRVKIQGSYSYQGEKSVSGAHVAKGIFVTVVIMILISNVATQYLAQSLQYSPALGEPFFVTTGRTRFYLPHMAWIWLFHLIQGGVRNEAVTNALLMLIGGVIVSAMMLCLACMPRQAKGKLANVHGSARWANKQDLVEAVSCLARGKLPRR